MKYWINWALYSKLFNQFQSLHVRIWRLKEVRIWRLKTAIMAVEPKHRYSNEAERAKWDIYNDLKLKNPLVSMVYTNIYQSCNLGL